MIISVKVKVYDGANWDAKVSAIDYEYPRTPESKVLKQVELSLVLPGEEREFSATDTRDILVQEVKRG